MTIEMTEQEWGILGAIDKLREAKLEFNRFGDGEFKEWAYGESNEEKVMPWYGYARTENMIRELLREFLVGCLGCNPCMVSALEDMACESGESFMYHLKNHAHDFREWLP